MYAGAPCLVKQFAICKSVGTQENLFISPRDIISRRTQTSIKSLLSSIFVVECTESTKFRLSQKITTLTESQSIWQDNNSFKIVHNKTLDSADSIAAKHSAASVLFTTLRIRLLCQAIGQYVPLLSTKNVIKAPCEPPLGRVPKLASQKETTEH